MTLETLQNKTKEELEIIGREFGVELDRRKRREDLIKQLTEVIMEKSVEKRVVVKAGVRKDGVDMAAFLKEGDLVEVAGKITREVIVDRHPEGYYITEEEEYVEIVHEGMYYVVKEDWLGDVAPKKEDKEEK